MSIDQMIEVLQAAKAGKQIQFRKRGKNEWSSFHEGTSSFAWQFWDYEYRVKPEPREWWLPDDYAPMTGPPKTHGFDVKWVRVREVLE